MPKKDTKERILTESLALFSKNGYDGVSMRDIAKAVGFRESALYKHYKSKQSILDMIFENMKNRYIQATKAVQLPESNDFSVLAREYQNNGLKGLKQFSSAIFLFWLRDEQASQFRRLLVLEQFRHTEAEKLLREFLMDGVLEYQTALFAQMIDIGYFKKINAEVLALQFYAPIYLLLCKYDGQPERESEAINLLERFVTEFDATYKSEVRR